MRKTPEKGIITIAFDDAYLDTYKHAIKHLCRLDIKSTIAVPSFLIGKRFEQRPLAGLRELKKSIKAGHEIASHTLAHPNLLRLSSKNKEAATHEITESKRKLRSLLNYKVSSFVFPYINKNRSKALRLKAKGYYESARITSDNSSFNKIPPKDPYSIVGFSVMKKHSLSYLKKQVDRALKKKCWLIMVFHLVSRKNTASARRPKPYRFFTHIDDFKKLIQYILSKDVLILRQKDAIQKFRDRAINR